MPDTKITALAAIATVDPAADVLPIVDISDTSMAASGTTKKVTSNQILQAGGTATLASATITGDLTVDTSTLKVDSTNNRVGIGTATPITPFDIRSNGNAAALFLRTTDPAAAVASAYIQAPVSTGFSSTVPVYGFWYQNSGMGNPAADTLNWIIASGEAMRLNSTGLGVGGSVVNKMTVTVAPGTSTSDGLRVTDSTRSIISGQTGATYSYLGIGGNQNLIYTSGGRLDIAADGQSLFLRTGTNNYLNLDSSGNVGIGVTPSAWASSYKAIQIGSTGCYNYRNFTNAVGNNYYNDGTNDVKIIGGFALKYEQNASTPSHSWWRSTTGTGTVSWTQDMTLDASGNLLVGKTVVNDFSIGFQATPTGAVVSTRAASTDGTGSTMSVYSTGAAAYRFYVGMGGTVYATNTTISAISDARLKENVQDIDVGLGAILALKPRKFDWKAGKGKDIKGDRGFIAQEFEQVFPQLVDEWKDEAPEGEAPYKSVRQDLIPVLVKAIQELAAEVNALKNA